MAPIVDKVRSAAGALRHSRRPSLELEIAESVLLEDSGETLMPSMRCANSASQIVLDDFGTGYSSLSYLREISRRQDQDRPFLHLRR